MKFRKSYLYILVTALLISLVGSLYYVKNLEQPDSEGMLFVTLGIDREKTQNEVSSYELMRAAEHFSDVVLGWTLDPAFLRELSETAGYEVSVNAQKQEKQNLIFYVSADSESYDSQIQSAIKTVVESRLQEYNSATNTSFVLAVSRFSELESYLNGSRIVFGVILLTLLITTSLILAFEYAKANWSRSSSAS